MRELSTLEEKLGYHFQNIDLLQRAMYHSSYANEHRASGEIWIIKRQ